MLQGRGGLSICMRIYAEVEKKLGNKEKRQEIFLAAGSSHFYISNGAKICVESHYDCIS